MSKLAYVHSFIIDNDNNAIDIWGKDSIENVALKFGLIEIELDETEHYRLTENLKRNFPKEYNGFYDESVEIIKDCFN